MGPVGGSWSDFLCLIGSVDSGVVRTKASLLLGRKKWVIISVGRAGAVTGTEIASAAENAHHRVPTTKRSSLPAVFV